MQRVHEELPLIALIAAQTIANVAKTSGWVDGGLYHELFGELVLGDMANETIDFKIEQATDNAGTGAKVLKASTQLAASAAANDNKVLQISVATDKLDTTNSFRWVRLSAITGGATGGMGTGTLRGRPRYKPGAQSASVVESATL